MRHWFKMIYQDIVKYYKSKKIRIFDKGCKSNSNSFYLYADLLQICLRVSSISLMTEYFSGNPLKVI